MSASRRCYLGVSDSHLLLSRSGSNWCDTVPTWVKPSCSEVCSDMSHELRSCLPPLVLLDNDNLYGDYLYSTPFTDDEERARAVSVTYEVSRAERKITDKRYDQLRPLFLFTDKRSLNIHC